MIPMFKLLSSSFTDDDKSFSVASRADAEVALRRWAASMAYSTWRRRPDGSMVVMRLSYSEDEEVVEEEWDEVLRAWAASAIVWLELMMFKFSPRARRIT